ncbi:MAG TPA: cell division protein FtsQ [Cytophagaceae bacterium]|jgi:cell division protein FtsQ
MLFKKLKVGKSIYVVGILLTLLALISFVDKKESRKKVKNIIIKIDDKYDNYFVDESEVLKLLTDRYQDFLLNKHLEEVSLKQLEQRVLTHKFIKDADVYKDHKGNIIVNIIQRQPVARIVSTDGPHWYIDGEGKTFPTSEKFTARVILIDGDFTKDFKRDSFFIKPQGKQYLEFINGVNGDEFWKAQVAQISINKYGEISMYPQVGSHTIYLGTPESYGQKLSSLKIFYKKVLPQKGWNKYKKISTKYKNQIICE